jgi:putative transposase
MARKLRLEFPGAIYHVMSRGDRREEIVRDDLDREHFLKTLGEACSKTGWEVHAFCVMNNHFHLILETPQPNLIVGMKWFLGTYTVRFNRRHKLAGHLFSGRYKSLLVGGEGGYLRTVCDYVHLNPVRGKLLAEAVSIRNYRWSSFPLYLQPSQRPFWLRFDRLLGECGIREDTSAGRRRFEERLELLRHHPDESFKSIRQGWCFGDEQFRKELLLQLTTKLGAYHYGSEVRETAEEKANRIITEEFQTLGWTNKDPSVLRKGDPDKVAIAKRLRAETTMTLSWICQRLDMGKRAHLAHLLYWQARNQRVPQKGKEMWAGSLSQPKKPEKPIPLTDPIVFDVSFD